ncbi:MAG TPA: ribonuclease P protein component [Candidatus Limnocylindria bacterium]|jgi:ribonuclease P protein component
MDAARLRRSEDIARCRAEGLARSDRLFSLRARASGTDAVRVAVSSSRAVGSAVRRNRARRRIREAIRLELAGRAPGAGAGMDLVFAARAAAIDAPAAMIRVAVARELAAVFRAAGGPAAAR